jgi:mono/diheme cytochrome c family protein
MPLSAVAASKVRIASAVGAVLTALAALGVRQPPDGKDIYATTCAACHQPTGLGLAEQYPPLAESDWVTGDEERLIRVVLHGLTGDIEVAGEPFSGAMPAWGPTLNDAQIAAVLTYVRSAWGNTAPAVSVGSVKRVRQVTASRTAPWTVKELMAVRPPPATGPPRP